MKEGAVVTNWKKRWFVVKPDYSVDYFETEEVRKITDNLTQHSIHFKKNPNQREL